MAPVGNLTSLILRLSLIRRLVMLNFGDLWENNPDRKYRVARTLEPRKATLLGGGPFSQTHSPLANGLEEKSSNKNNAEDVYVGPMCA